MFMKTTWLWSEDLELMVVPKSYSWKNFQKEQQPQTNGALGSRTQHVLVLGAGELGRCVLYSIAHYLSTHPEEDATLTVMLRPSISQERQNQIGYYTEHNVGHIAGDVASQSVEELASVFQHFDTIVGCTGFGCPPGTQVNICKAVLTAKVSLYIPWQFGVDYDAIGRGSPMPLFDEQLDVRDMLRSQDQTRWVILSTGMFTSFLFEKVFGVVELPSEKDAPAIVRALGNWNNRVTTTAPEDIGTFVCGAIFYLKDRRDQIVFVAGDTVSYGRLALTVSKVLGKEVQREQWDLDHLYQEKMKDPSPMNNYRALFAEGRGVAWDMKDTVHGEEKAKQLMSVEGWLRKKTGYDDGGWPKYDGSNTSASS